MPHTADPLELLQALVAIDSVNPALSPGGAGEQAAADFCGRWLGERGFEVHRLERRPGRPSVVGVLKGTGGGRSIMLNGHLDTVAYGTYEGDPLSPRVEDGPVHGPVHGRVYGRVYGRGAFDMKSGVAAMLAAAARATAAGRLRGDVIVACVADEEHASSGTEEVLERFTADGAVVTEPSMLEVTLAHKGFAWFEVDVLGRAAHGSRPDLGIDAIAKAGHFLVALEELGARLAAAGGHPLLGPGTVHASMIDGGEGPSTYPARCRITVERRTVPGEPAAAVRDELAAILDRLAATVPGFRYELRAGLHREPFEADPGAPITRVLLAQAERVLGRSPVIRAEPFWTDCALLAAAGIPCLLFGVSGGGAHADEEWADIASLHQVTDVLTGTVTEFCAG